MKRITSYAITCASDRPERDPKDWRLMGSNDGGGTWTVLDERKGEMFSNRSQRRLFAIQNPAAYNIYRLQIDSVSAPLLADSVQLAELELLSLQEPHAGSGDSWDLVVRAAGENHPAESAAYAFDRRADTKWLDFASKSPLTRASWIEVQYVAAALEITNVSMLICGPAGESKGGRPVRIEGIVAGTDTVGKRVEVLDGAGSLEIPFDRAAEFKVGQSVLLEGKTTWVETKEANGKTTIEQSVIDAKLTLLKDKLPLPQKPQNYATIAARAAPDAKIVVQYALTSANDRPGRDPNAWRLLASNDHGLSWVTLDERKDEVFPLRFQRRLFSVTNDTPYNLYRLQIDSIQGESVENAVQLAEFELISPPEEDQRVSRFAEPFISAKGENPPRESVTAAFDENPGTKWLDFAFESPGSSWLQVQYLPIRKQITNLAQLRETLRLHVRRSIPVHIEGIIANFDARGQQFYFLDGTGGLHVPASSTAVPCRPGQEVLLEGQTAFVAQQVHQDARQFEPIVLQPRITLLQKPLLQPELIRPGEPMVRGKLCPLAEVVGAVRFVSQGDAGAVLELAEANDRLSIFCSGADATRFRRYLNLRVRARGVCEGILNEQSTVVAGRLWTAGAESISLAEPTDNEWNAFPLTPIGRLHRELGPFADVIHVRGTATRQEAGQELILTEDYHTVTVELGAKNGSALSGQVEALGFLGWRDQAPVLLQAYCRSAARTNADSQVSQMLLTQVEQILRLPPNEQELTYDAHIRGVVTSPSGYVNDQTGGIYVEQLRDLAVQPGDFVEIFGHAGSRKTFNSKSYSPVVHADGARVLGRGRWPEPKTFSWNYLMTGQPDGQWIEVRGIGRAANTNVLTLSVEGGALTASILGAHPEDMNRWIDANVRVRGVYRTAFNENGQFQGFSLDVPDIECVQVDKPPAPDPFGIPVQKAVTLLTYDPLDKLAHRHKIAGVVSHAEETFFFIQDVSGGLQVRSSRPALVHSGTAVEVVGFPEGGGFSPTLVEALVRKTGTKPLPAPARISVDDIFKGDHEGSFVSLQATLLGQKLNGSTAILELQAQQQAFRALLPARELPKANYPPGTRVELHGVFKADRNLDQHGAQRVSAFDFFLNDSADVIVLARPSWWTFKHTAGVLGTLGAVLLAASGWIRILRHKVEQRSKELLAEIAERGRTEEKLKAEIAERKRIELEVEEAHKELLLTARQAGMAEVATSVLHNVGNVLNSVNVTATLIDELVRKSRAPDLGRVAKLLREHSADLGTFLSQDGRGRKVPEFLTQLSERLDREQSTVRAEATLLRNNVAHIKDIVAMQQSYGKVSGLIESVEVAALVEDTLRINAGSSERQDVEVIREYDPVPAISTDKHKVLQILVNLVGNAKNACDESRRSDKRILLRINNEDSAVRISVADNGVGIPPEHLTRIFNHGFTTRKDGHGFGLHSGALAAKELGGSLTVRSDGVGKGATFTLELPKTTPAGLLSVSGKED